MLASSTVRDLVAGSGTASEPLTVAPHGEWRLFRVDGAAEPRLEA